MGDRYDTVRDRLPELLERYGDLRDASGVKRMLGEWRTRRIRSGAGAPADDLPEPRVPVEAGRDDLN
jgi:hypothetical protein